MNSFYSVWTNRLKNFHPLTILTKSVSYVKLMKTGQNVSEDNLIPKFFKYLKTLYEVTSSWIEKLSWLTFYICLSDNSCNNYFETDFTTLGWYLHLPGSLCLKISLPSSPQSLLKGLPSSNTQRSSPGITCMLGSGAFQNLQQLKETC